MEPEIEDKFNNVTLCVNNLTNSVDKVFDKLEYFEEDNKETKKMISEIGGLIRKQNGDISNIKVFQAKCPAENIIKDVNSAKSNIRKLFDETINARFRQQNPGVQRLINIGILVLSIASVSGIIITLLYISKNIKF